MDEQNFKADDIFKAMQAQSNFEILPCDNITDVDSKPGYVKIGLTDSQKIQVSGLMAQMPAVAATGAMTQMYMAKFPSGVPHTLVQLNQGGYMSFVKDADNKFLSVIPLYKTTPQAVALGAFSALSIASGQYFLSQINNEMKLINQSIDKILEFLYGDKKAELMSEINFVKYAYENHNYIMEYPEQRAGIIAGLVEAKKVAMKDIEFYVGDLNSTVNSGKNDIKAIVDQAYNIKDSLELSMQLYAMSNILEVYYSQNFEPNYIKYIENDVSYYISKCEKRMLGDFGILRGMVIATKDKLFGKFPKERTLSRLDKTLEEFKNAEESPLHKSLHSALSSVNKDTTYFISPKGDVYMSMKAA